MPRQKPASPTPIRVLRDVIELTQTQFATLVGVSVDTIKSLETDRMPVSEAMKERIHRATGVHKNTIDRFEDLSEPEVLNGSWEEQKRRMMEAPEDPLSRSIMTIGEAAYTREDFENWRQLHAEVVKWPDGPNEHECREIGWRVQALLRAAASRPTQSENLLAELWTLLEDARHKYGLEAESLRQLQTLTKGQRQDWNANAPPGHVVYYRGSKREFSPVGADGVPAYVRELEADSQRRRARATAG